MDYKWNLLHAKLDLLFMVFEDIFDFVHESCKFLKILV